MGEITQPLPGKLFIGGLFASQSLFDEVCKRLSRDYGPIEIESELWNFHFTRYYEKDMGSNLYRKFISFTHLIEPGDIVEIKLQTNRLEEEFARLYAPPKRPLNLDPGYLHLAKLILATTKDFSHRIYLGKGIYAEVTLRYSRNSFYSLEWTFPDYRSELYLQFFNNLRTIYKKQLQFMNLL